MSHLPGRPIGALMLMVWLLTGPGSAVAGGNADWGEVASGEGVDNLFKAAFLGAGLALVVTGIVMDDSDRYSYYMYNDQGMLEEINLYPKDNGSWREDPEALVVAGVGCLGLALIFHLFPSDESSGDKSPGKDQIGLESRWVGDGPVVGLGGSF